MRKCHTHISSLDHCKFNISARPNLSEFHSAIFRTGYLCYPYTIQLSNISRLTVGGRFSTPVLPTHWSGVLCRFVYYVVHEKKLN